MVVARGAADRREDLVAAVDQAAREAVPGAEDRTRAQWLRAEALYYLRLADAQASLQQGHAAAAFADHDVHGCFVQVVAFGEAAVFFGGLFLERNQRNDPTFAALLETFIAVCSALFVVNGFFIEVFIKK